MQIKHKAECYCAFCCWTILHKPPSTFRAHFKCRLTPRSALSLLTNWIPDCNTRYMRDRIRRSRSSAKSDRTSKPICRKAHTHSSDPAANYQRNQSTFLIPFDLNPSSRIIQRVQIGFLWRERPPLLQPALKRLPFLPSFSSHLIPI